MEKKIYCSITGQECKNNCPPGGYIGTGYGCLNTSIKPTPPESKSQVKQNVKKK